MDRHEKLMKLAEVLMLAASKAREIAKAGRGDGVIGREFEIADEIEAIASDLQSLAAREKPNEVV